MNSTPRQTRRRRRRATASVPATVDWRGRHDDWRGPCAVVVDAPRISSCGSTRIIDQDSRNSTTHRGRRSADRGGHLAHRRGRPARSGAQSARGGDLRHASRRHAVPQKEPFAVTAQVSARTPVRASRKTVRNMPGDGALCGTAHTGPDLWALSAITQPSSADARPTR